MVQGAHTNVLAISQGIGTILWCILGCAWLGCARFHPKPETLPESGRLRSYGKLASVSCVALPCVESFSVAGSSELPLVQADPRDLIWIVRVVRA